MSAARFFVLLPDGRVEITDAWSRRVFRWNGQRWTQTESLSLPRPELALAPVWPAWPTYTRATIRGSPTLSRRRCRWAREPLDVAYHDREWGVPVRDDRRLFEFLLLEGAQAGLSWSIILRKRPGYRRAFAGFDPRRVARFGPREVRRLLADEGIVRNRAKIAAAVGNAQAFLAVQAEHGSFAEYLWRFVGGRPAAESLALARRGSGRDRRVAGAQRRSAAARLPLRRADDLLRLHAGGRPRERSHAGLLPPRPVARLAGGARASQRAAPDRRGHRRSSSKAAAISRPRSAITRRPVSARAAAGQPK